MCVCVQADAGHLVHFSFIKYLYNISCMMWTTSRIQWTRENIYAAGAFDLGQGYYYYNSAAAQGGRTSAFIILYYYYYYYIAPRDLCYGLFIIRPHAGNSVVVLVVTASPSPSPPPPSFASHIRNCAHPNNLPVCVRVCVVTL